MCALHKWKNELVTQSCLTRCDPVECSLPGSSLCPRNSPGKRTGVGCHFLLQGIFSTQGSNPALPHCWWTLYRLSHQRIVLYTWGCQRSSGHLWQANSKERKFFKWPHFTQFSHLWSHGVLKSGCGPEWMTQGNTLLLVLPTWFSWTSHRLASSCPQVHKPLSFPPASCAGFLWFVGCVLRLVPSRRGLSCWSNSFCGGFCHLFIIQSQAQVFLPCFFLPEIALFPNFSIAFSFHFLSPLHSN